MAKIPGQSEIMVDDLSGGRRPLGDVAEWNPTGTALVDPVTGADIRRFMENAADGIFRFADFRSTTGLTATGTGVTIAVDNTVLFNGEPTLKMTIPAATTGNVSVGVDSAVTPMPDSWDGTRTAFAFKTNNASRMGALTFYLGDANYTNHYTTALNPIVQEPNLFYGADEWIFGSPGNFTSSWSVGSGSPTFTGTKQWKLQASGISSAGTDTNVWFAMAGVMRKRPKAKFIIRLDDAYVSWWNFIQPISRHYNIPTTMSIIAPAESGIGQAWAMSESQLETLINDSSRLFSAITHSDNNISVDGTDVYVNKAIACRTYLQSLGAGDSANFHAWVQNNTTSAGIDALADAGFTAATAGAYSGSTYKYCPDGMMFAGHKRRYALNICAALDSGMSLATAKTNIDNVITAGQTGIIMGHNFASSAGVVAWTYEDAIALYAYLATKRDAGLCEIVHMVDWWNQVTEDVAPAY